MAEGTVRWFSDAQGHGCIVPDGVPDGDGWDVRFDRDEIRLNGYRSLEAGERVSFDFDFGFDGEPRAVQVTPLGTRAPLPGTGPSTTGARPTADMPGWLGCLLGLFALLVLSSVVAFLAVGLARTLW